MKSEILSDEQLTSVLSKESENVLSRHLNSFANHDLESLMGDYTEQSVLITHDAIFSGVKEIHRFFTDLLTHFPKQHSSFVLDKQVINDELGFIVWHGKTPSLEVLLGTDTFIIKKGKIHRQTFAGQLNFLV